MDLLKKNIKKYYEECDKSYQHWGEEEIYSLHYGFWDKKTSSHVDSLKNMNEFLAKKLGIKQGNKILDAGCGVGGSLIWLAENYNDIEVVGITLSEMQHKKADNFIRKRGLSKKAKVYIKDFNNTNFPDESFDVVWAIESVCHSEEKEKFIKEAYRILKKDGKLIISDGFIKKEKLTKLDNFLLNNWIKGWMVPNLAQVDRFKESLEKNSFKNVEFEDITKNILKSSKEIFKRGILGWPVYKLKNKNQIHMKHIKGCIFQYFALKKNIWCYGVLYAEK